MKTLTLFPCTLVLALGLLLLPGCAADTVTGPDQLSAAATEAASEAEAAADKRGRVYVFNTQLRPLPGDEPSEAYGHFQLKLQRVSGVSPNPFYKATWKGTLFNPAGEIVTGGQVSGISPQPFRPVLVLMEGARETSRKIDLRGAGRLSEGQAEAIIAHPERFLAVYMTAAMPEGAVAGNFEGTTPDDG